ncbi:uncharacterized protein LOC126424698 [Schistocerca serialis cubense]|uniref:uncharacterized protein LOC126424698 n=1 Tax=Schistocerca serialis cubense TaxID=2023355 RepID=UPI00214E066C|nr:uncharacterized protein LOC126424698 [Schistocerca serialis cubense]
MSCSDDASALGARSVCVTLDPGDSTGPLVDAAAPHTGPKQSPRRWPSVRTLRHALFRQDAPLGSAMVRKMVSVCSEAAFPARSIATYFLVTTGLELVALPLLCYEFAFRERVLEGQLEKFRGDPQPGALASSLPGKIRHMHERMLSCFLYTGFTIIKQIFNIVLLIGQRKSDPRLVMAWVWGFSAMHVATTAVALWFGVRTYFDLDIVAMLVLLYLFLISGVVLARSVVVVVRTARQQLQAVKAAGAADC